MSVCVECLVKNDFRNFDDLKAVEAELKRGADVINDLYQLEGENRFVPQLLAIDNSSLYSESEFYDFSNIYLKKGYWHISSGNRYYELFEPNLMVGQIFVNIAKAFGQNEAWYCDEFHLDNCGSHNWNYDTQSFEEWLLFAESKLGTKIPEFPVEEIKAFRGDWFPSKPIYHDSF